MTKAEQNDLLLRGRSIGLKMCKEYLRGERGIVIENMGECLMDPSKESSFISIDYNTMLHAITSIGEENV